jgi:hypothetical protein
LPGPAELVDLALAHGYRLSWLSQAGLDEWDEFESGRALGWERRPRSWRATR